MNWCNRFTNTPWCAEGVCISSVGQAATVIQPRYEPFGSGVRENWVEWDVTSIVEAWLTGSEPNYGFCVWQTPQSGHNRNQQINFASSDHVDAESIGPQLVAVEATPTEVPQEVPVRTLLKQNHPNPFNPSTTIQFELKRACHVQLQIFDVAGRLVNTLVDEERKIGLNEVLWRGQDSGGKQVATGVYLYRLRADGYVETRRMVLLK